VHRHEVGSPQPQGSSLLPELCCLEPSSLNRPHPPHSWAHRIFTGMAAYTRCLRCAGAPGRPASGSGLSLSILSWHTVLSDPGEFDHRQFQRSDVDAAFAESRAARHSQNSWTLYSLPVSRRLANVYRATMRTSFWRVSLMTSDTFAELSKAMRTCPILLTSLVVPFVSPEARPMRRSLRIMWTARSCSSWSA
jgi:hypothetical protein